MNEDGSAMFYQNLKSMKKYYEIYLMQHVTGSVEDDYETVDYECESCSYRECQKMAKELSKHYGTYFERT